MVLVVFVFFGLVALVVFFGLVAPVVPSGLVDLIMPLLNDFIACRNIELEMPKWEPMGVGVVSLKSLLNLIRRVFLAYFHRSGFLIYREAACPDLHYG